MLNSVDQFDYECESTLEGHGILCPLSHDLAGLRLGRCLPALPAQRSRLLEVGCGVGRHARSIKRLRPEFDVNACDVSRAALRLAGAESQGVRYVAADAQALPYLDSSFDAVILFDVLEHLRDVNLAVSEIARVLRPGGIVHGFVPCEGNSGTLFHLLRGGRCIPIHDWKRRQVGHIQALTTRDLLSLFKAAGLRTTTVSFSFHMLGQLFDVVDYWRREAVSAHGKPLCCVGLYKAAGVLLSVLWRLAYYEDRLLWSNPRAAGVHITAVK
jgi:SAM-dependent methyltransferase